MLLAQCVPTVPPTEFCDGIDNDCDGIIDEAAGNTYTLHLIADDVETKISNPGNTVANQAPLLYTTGDGRLPNIDDSNKWIKHATSDSSSLYWIQRDFNIPSLYLLGTPTISATIKAAGNDQLRAYINGDTNQILEDLNAPHQGGFVTENFNNGFVAGSNKLRFKLTNGDREASMNYVFDLSINSCIPIQCQDRIDNDNDLTSGGGIDALEELIPENNCADITYTNGENNCDRYGHSFYFGKTTYLDVYDFINSFQEYDDIGKKGAYFCNDTDADKLCELKGYEDYQIINLRSVGEENRTECSRDKCNSDRSCTGFHSQSDNYFAFWDPNAANPNGGYSGNLVRMRAVQGKRGLQKVLCTNPIASSCWDGIDNGDNDGKIDFCVTPSAPATFTFEDHYSTTVVPFLNTFGYRTINGGLNNDAATLNKICNLKGYDTASSHTSRTWSSCSNNDNWYWSSSENNFVNGGGCYNGGRHLTTLTCSNPKPCDEDCASRFDISEYPHDPQCVDVNDDDEGGPAVVPDPVDPLCDLNQTILILDNNGEILPLSEDSNGERICYNTIFGVTNTDPDATMCTGNNVVLRLNASTGFAHIPESTGSDLTDVCYDNLVCNSITTGSCAADEFTTVRLSAETEAEIGNASSTLPVQICCKIVNPAIDGAYWSEPFRDQKINSTNLNSLVRLRINGIGLEDKTVDYVIKRRTGGFLDFLIPDRTVATGSEEGFPTWRAGEDENGNLVGGEYYFIATIDSLGLEFDTSNSPDEDYRYLEVSDTQVNNPPTALIKFPEDKQIYFIDSPIFFEQGSFDIDDGFSYEWELGDGTVKEGNTSNYNNYNFTHTYAGEENLGAQDIRLTVTDDRGLTSVDLVSILVINSTYVLAYIDEPRIGGDFGRNVPHNASSTYAVSSETGADGCTKTITCEAGNCPSETKGCPACYDGLEGRPDSSQCPIAVSGSPQPLDRIEFCWEWFFDNRFLSSSCNTGDAGAVFDKPLGNIGFNVVNLNATLLP